MANQTLNEDHGGGISRNPERRYWLASHKKQRYVRWQTANTIAALRLCFLNQSSAFSESHFISESARLVVLRCFLESRRFQKPLTSLSQSRVKLLAELNVGHPSLLQFRKGA